MATNPFIGEVRPFGFNFNPRGWAFCQGQLLAISSNTALFSLLGTTYGGDGRTTFGLPDFQGRMPLGMGQGPGLPNYDWGQEGGAATVTLLTTNLPAHTHGLTAAAALPAQSGPGSLDSPVNNVPAGSAAVENYSPPAAVNTSLGGGTASLTAQPTGSGQPFGKMPPYLTLNLCIALQGVFPARS
jgi:microcystin-dependent protein